MSDEAFWNQRLRVAKQILDTFDTSAARLDSSRLTQLQIAIIDRTEQGAARFEGIAHLTWPVVALCGSAREDLGIDLDLPLADLVPAISRFLESSQRNLSPGALTGQNYDDYIDLKDAAVVAQMKLLSQLTTTLAGQYVEAMTANARPFALRRGLISIALQLLPPAQRRRYAEEWSAQLAELGRVARIRFALSLIAWIPSIRSELRGRASGAA